MVEQQENTNNLNTGAVHSLVDPDASEFQSSTISKRQKFLAEQANDPILNSSSEEEAGDSDDQSGSAAESSEEDVDFEFPREDATELMQFLHREVTNIANLEDHQKRKFALVKMYQVFVLAKNKPLPRVYGEILPQIQKLLYKRFTDTIEKNRELATLIVKEFFSRVDDLSLSIPYLIPILVQRLNAEDIEGIDYLPPQMRPQANQKPLVMIDPPETSEAVRLNIAEICTIMVSSTVFDCMRPYTQEIINILRSLCMDPAGQVIIEGCQAMKEFAISGNEQLIHFCEVMGRALFTAFVHKHAKVRMAGLKSLFDVMVCGKFKHSHAILAHMVGFRDPNIVPIKDFYDPSTKLNYFASFVADRSVVVRECFYRTVGDLLARLPDKVDHEGQLFPYLISGLYDQNDSICQTVFEIIEELGLSHEEANEEKFRERKQLGFHEEWTLNGLLSDAQKDLPFPIAHRPRLGSRVLVRSYVRRYIKAIFHELGDWIEENAERTSNLLLFSIIYSEDFMVQFMDEMLVNMYKVVLTKTNRTLAKNMPLAFKFLGRYCMPVTYDKLIIPAISNELASCFAHTQAGAVKGFGFLFKGAVELLPDSENLTKVDGLLKNFMKAIKEHVIDALDLELGEILVQTLNEIVSVLIEKQRAGVDPAWLIRPHLVDIMMMALKAMATFQSFQLQGKPDPENITAAKKLIRELFSKLSELSSSPDQSFFDFNIGQVIADAFSLKQSDQFASLSLQSPTWRLFHALFDYLTSEHLQQVLPEPESVFVQQQRVRQQQQKEMKQVTFEKIQEDEQEEEAEGCRVEEVVEEVKVEEQKTGEEVVAMASQEETAQENDAPTEETEPKETPKQRKERLMAKKFIEIEEQESETDETAQKTMFQEICRVFLSILKNSESPNLKVKRIALYQLFPKLVNISLPFITYEHSNDLMRIMVRGCKVEWGGENEKIKQFGPHLRLASEFVTSGGLVLDINMGEKSIANFNRVLLTFKRCYLDANEKMKREILRLMYVYVEQLNEQVISKIENGTELLEGTSFLHAVTADLIEMIKDFYDSVRDAACTLLEYIMTHFLRQSPIEDATKRDLLQILRASSNSGVSESMWAPTKSAADQESEFVNYIFTDAQEFLKLLIQAMLDEPSTRESIIRVILKLNKQLPFLLMNDYRIACANRSLQRQEVIRGLLQRAQSS